jgi:hypothetical protein
MAAVVPKDVRSDSDPPTRVARPKPSNSSRPIIVVSTPSNPLCLDRMRTPNRCTTRPDDTEPHAQTQPLTVGARTEAEGQLDVSDHRYQRPDPERAVPLMGFGRTRVLSAGVLAAYWLSRAVHLACVSTCLLDPNTGRPLEVLFSRFILARRPYPTESLELTRPAAFRLCAS